MSSINHKLLLRIKKYAAVLAAFCLVLTQTGCSGKQYSYAFDVNNPKNAFRFENHNSTAVAKSFAGDLAVVEGDVDAGEEVESGADSYASAVLFSVNDSETVYSRNAFATLYPASMTKVMTAMVAMEEGNPDRILTFTEACQVTEEGAQKIDLAPGDTMTLDQALHILLLYSANDVANLIAVGLDGSIEGFCDKMNKRALELGATKTHFANPNGLHDENHYTCAYDMYLMFNEAIKNEEFKQIIGMMDYSTSYKDADGNPKEFKCETTNRYLKGQVNAPTNVTVVGGKTGTTLAAGACLVLLSRSASGKQYISCVMKGDNIDVTYAKTNALLELINGY